MAKIEIERTEGIKVFFVTPDLSMISESFVESAFLQGFETYLLLDDPYLQLGQKIEYLIKIFKELILFITIDKSSSIPKWIEYIANLQKQYQENIRIGVLYKNVHTPEISRKLEKAFLFNIGINCGCIPMHFSKSRNQSLLLDVLTANQAAGRRKSIRLLCSEKYRLNLVHDGIKYEGLVKDISISHFSCEFVDKEPEMALYKKMSNIQLLLSGTMCMVNAMLAIKRVVQGKPMYVFVFKNNLDKEGLDDITRSKLNAMICSTFQSDMTSYLDTQFKRIRSSLPAQKLRKDYQNKADAKSG